MRAAALTLPLSRSRLEDDVGCAVVSFEDCFVSGLVDVCFPAWAAATDLLTALTASCVALATFSLSAAGLFLPLMMTVDRLSDLEALASLASRVLVAFAWEASFALLAFFSLMYCISGVVETLSALPSAASAPLAFPLVMGSVKLCKKSMNSWS